LGTEICRLLTEQGIDYNTLHLDKEGRWVYYFRDEPPPDVIINCAGVRQSTDTSAEMVRINALEPQRLQGLLARYDSKIVYVSTDCVFSGSYSGRWGVIDTPNPDSLYGITKRAGELAADLVIRTSFIGERHGLLRWVLDEARASSQEKRNQIEGWLGALWTGSTVDIVAQGILRVVSENRGGIVHIASSKVMNKYDVIRTIRDVYELELDIQPTYEPRINRALQPTVPIDIDLRSALSAYRQRNHSSDTSRALSS
jgi:dTDP-4-dehydrorhamnose reductase